MKKIMLIALPLLFCVSPVSHVLYYFDIRATESIYAYKVSFASFQFTGALWMYSKGSFRKDRLRIIAYIGIAAFFISQTLIVMHWVGARMILLLSSIGIVASYGIHFLKKSKKIYLDWLKLTWVILFLSLMTIGVFYDRNIRLWIGWTFNINSVILIGLFYFKTYKRKESGRFELSEDEAFVFDYKEG